MANIGRYIGASLTLTLSFISIILNKSRLLSIKHKKNKRKESILYIYIKRESVFVYATWHSFSTLDSAPVSKLTEVTKVTPSFSLHTILWPALNNQAMTSFWTSCVAIRGRGSYFLYCYDEDIVSRSQTNVPQTPECYVESGTRAPEIWARKLVILVHENIYFKIPFCLIYVLILNSAKQHDIYIYCICVEWFILRYATGSSSRASSLWQASLVHLRSKTCSSRVGGTGADHTV